MNIQQNNRYLKSSMDRFIGSTAKCLIEYFPYLKSSMDRFIVTTEFNFSCEI